MNNKFFVTYTKIMNRAFIDFISGATNGFILGSLMDLSFFTYECVEANGDPSQISIAKYFYLPLRLLLMVGVGRVLTNVCFSVRKNSALDWQIVLFMSIVTGHIFQVIQDFILTFFYEYKIQESEGNWGVVIVVLFLWILYNLLYSVIIRNVSLNNKFA